jgi:hypothetical protein
LQQYEEGEFWHWCSEISNKLAQQNMGAYFMPVQIYVETFIQTTVALAYVCVLELFTDKSSTSTISIL